MARFATLSPAGRVFINPIVRGEILYGLRVMPEGRRKHNSSARAAELFQVLLCEPIPENAGDQYGRIKSEAERRGLRLDENDLWIAATALALEAVLVTRDGHFRRVNHLLVEDWSK